MPCSFNKSWLLMSEFKDWLQPTSNPHDAYCSFCRKKFSLSNMGQPALRNHMKGQKHKAITKSQSSSINNFWNPSPLATNTPSTSNSKVVSTAASNTSISSSVVSSTPSNSSSIVLLNNAVTTMEIQWCLFAIKMNLSNRCTASAAQFFKFMVPNDANIENMSLGRTKVAYTIVHGIAPYVRKELLSELAKSPVYVACFDESLNKISTRGQMDIHVRFWVDNKVITRFLTFEFLGHATAANLVDSFNSALDCTDTSKLLQVGMDPSSSIPIFMLILKELRTKRENRILNHT